jgi:hypothetical protein
LRLARFHAVFLKRSFVYYGKNRPKTLETRRAVHKKRNREVPTDPQLTNATFFPSRVRAFAPSREPSSEASRTRFTFGSFLVYLRFTSGSLLPCERFTLVYKRLQKSINSRFLISKATHLKRAQLPIVALTKFYSSAASFCLCSKL